MLLHTGPGCSSGLGIFMELGPCRVFNDNGTTFHAESWNENANIFCVDQPIGGGFSYADYSEIVSTTEEAAKDIAAFVVIFFENFSQFKGRTFHIADESYGHSYRYIASFLNRPSVREALGVDPAVLANFTLVNDAVEEAFANAQDEFHQTYTHLARKREVDLGNAMDWPATVCESTTEGMLMGRDTWQVYVLDVIGAKSFICIATWVPYDKPKEALVMVQRRLAGVEF
ncbi:hypothetical protein ID866_7499 [Astraeus odoratus]|nr:hypothetical protein ID866_7499 [Astraeus odoratus]